MANRQAVLLIILFAVDCIAFRLKNIIAPCIRLRGGSEYSSLDPQLRAEILEDAYRMKQGKLPVFLEKLGEYDDGFGQYRYRSIDREMQGRRVLHPRENERIHSDTSPRRLLDGAEPMVPRAISADDDQDEVMAPAVGAGKMFTPAAAFSPPRTIPASPPRTIPAGGPGRASSRATSDPGGGDGRGARAAGGPGAAGSRGVLQGVGREGLRGRDEGTALRAAPHATPPPPSPIIKQVKSNK